MIRLERTRKTQYLSILIFFITENEYILLMIIFHLKNMKYTQKLIKIFFGKVLSDHLTLESRFKPTFSQSLFIAYTNGLNNIQIINLHLIY